MRNKPIINGIDVSDCSYYNKDNEPYCCEIWDNECEAQNCYFKQCKRLEQREKALTELADDLQKRNHDLTLTNERLEQENKELKAKFNELYNNAEQLANKYNKYSGNKENELVEIINKTTDERNKYKQALEEIRDRLIVVTEEEPQSTINLVLDLKPIIEGALNDRN